MRKLVTCLVALVVTVSANAAPIVVEPDDFASGTNISNAVPGVTLTAFSVPPTIIAPVPNSNVLSLPNLVGGYAPTGNRVFGTANTAAGIFQSSWYTGDHHFRATFATPTDFVSVLVAPDAIGDTDLALVEIYNAANVLLDSATPPGTGIQTVTFNRATADIAYMIIRNPTGVTGDSFIIDRLVFNDTTPVPEPVSLVVFGGLVLGGAGVALRRMKKVVA
jgi:hypothetical protein